MHRQQRQGHHHRLTVPQRLIVLESYLTLRFPLHNLPSFIILYLYRLLYPYREIRYVQSVKIRKNYTPTIVDENGRVKIEKEEISSPILGIPGLYIPEYTNAVVEAGATTDVKGGTNP